MDWSLIVAVNNQNVLNSTLLNSPDISSASSIIIQENYGNASSAYNEGIIKTKSDILIFPHQDVFFPKGWFTRLNNRIERLSKTNPKWGVIGVYGISKFNQQLGHVYSTGLKKSLGEDLKRIEEAISIDEMVIILRKSSGLQFDENLPGFHLYGTDICLESIKRGLSNYVASNFCIHNSNGIRVLPKSYYVAYRYMQRKWSDQLPISTPCMKLTRFGFPIIYHYLRWFLYDRFLFKPIGNRCNDPKMLYKKLIEINSKSDKN